MKVPVWVMALTHPPDEHPDLASAMRALQETLDEQRQQGLSVHPERISEKIGAVYSVRGEAGIERYWLSTDPPPD